MTVPTPNLTVENVAPDTRIYNARPAGAAGKIGAIVLHHTGGKHSLVWLSTYHDNPVSIHKLVPKVMWDGKPGLYQIVPDKERAWHAGDSVLDGHADLNDWSIGVEIENSGDGKDPYTPEQIETVSQVVAYATALYHIPDINVTSHARVALPKGRKNDPRGWDWRKMWERVDEIRKAWPYTIPEWSDNGDPRVMST